MNHWDIDREADLHCNHAVLGPATRFLQHFRDLIDNNSDGWAYWRPPVKAAKRLMLLIENPDTATEAAFKKALTPINTFCTKHKLPMPAEGIEWNTREASTKQFEQAGLSIAGPERPQQPEQMDLFSSAMQGCGPGVPRLPDNPKVGGKISQAANKDWIEMINKNGNIYPTFEGEALSWSIGLYDTANEAKEGYPRMRTVIRAMHQYRPEELRRERHELVRASFDGIFGQVAKRQVKIIDNEMEKLSGRATDLLEQNADDCAYRVYVGQPDNLTLLVSGVSKDEKSKLVSEHIKIHGLGSIFYEEDCATKPERRLPQRRDRGVTPS